ncbi:hypothetical protein BJ165DRAFT_1450904 [Panaeolus papilionaceus]|nr:hypothetical protein BJ165DRAFT_1450904 [Panaeolus papilionaceus]
MKSSFPLLHTLVISSLNLHLSTLELLFYFILSTSFLSSHFIYCSLLSLSSILTLKLGLTAHTRYVRYYGSIYRHTDTLCIIFTCKLYIS